MSSAILMIFFWKRYSSIGLIATIISGFIFTVLGISTGLDEIVTSKFSTFFIAAFLGVIFSLLMSDKKET